MVIKLKQNHPNQILPDYTNVMVRMPLSTSEFIDKEAEKTLMRRTDIIRLKMEIPIEEGLKILKERGEDKS